MNKLLVLTTIVFIALACQNLQTQEPADNTDDIGGGDGTTDTGTYNPIVHLTPPNYPVRVGYINKMTNWWGDAIAKDLGVPGFAVDHDYNYMLLSFWSCDHPLDVALMWASAADYFGGQSTLGKTHHEVQAAIREKYHSKGIKVLVSAFGGTEHPTSAGKDPKSCGHKLGNFILNNNLDGADIDWEDNAAMEAGTGQAWVITFTRALREIIPNHTVTHAPQAPYFKQEHYTNGAYVTINKAIGNLIDFYNVQFYNQGDSRYDSYQELFIQGTGIFSKTSVKEIADRGIPLKKIVVGKPLILSDAANTGYICQQDLGVWAAKAYDELGWYAGVMHWQYPSDKTGKLLKYASSKLIEKCKTHNNCK